MIVASDQTARSIILGGHVAQSGRVDDVASGLAVVRRGHAVAEGVVGVGPCVRRVHHAG